MKMQGNLIRTIPKCLIHLILLSLGLGILLTQRVLGQTTLVELENSTSHKGSTNFQMNYTTFLSTNTTLPKRTGHQSSQEHILSMRLSPPKGTQYSLSLNLNHDFTNEREFLLRDSLFMLTGQPKSLSSSVLFIPRTAITLPFSEVSNKFSGLITALRFNPIVTLRFASENTILRNLSFVYLPSVVWNIHQYQQFINGESNNQYSISQSLSALYSLRPHIFLSLDNTYIRSFTYEGKSNDFFSFNQSISYNFSRDLSLFLGHSLGGNALALSGQESNVQFFNIENSQYYTGVSYQF